MGIAEPGLLDRLSPRTAAIKSVLAQSFQDFELLVVDDRSTDATLEIVRSFQAERVYLFGS